MTEYQHGKIVSVNIEEEMRKSYMDYAMSVIAGRALPDVRDGLKPVHRRILYTMYELGVTADKPHKKSARIVGDVLGKYHPHGDTAVYDAMVRLAQDFSTRYLLVDGHGNFGSVDGDSAAAMRYTEARMSKITAEMLSDIGKNTVDFIDNYDGSMQEPSVLPSKIPNLLVNGSSGIAVGMATNIPPHNLGEVIDGVIAMIDNPEITIQELMKYIKGPDFPTSGIIVGMEGIRNAYETGRGSVKMRAQTSIEHMKNGKERIVVTELPYQVNKARLIEKIAELVQEKKIDGITDLRDESDRTGMRMVIELRRDINANVILNQLFKMTQLQDTFGVILLALVNLKPVVLNLKQIIHHYLNHQKEVYTRRTVFDLDKAQARAHILEGLRIAVHNMDEVIKIVRTSKNKDEARPRLMEGFKLSEKQAEAILELKIYRLTGLEIEKIEAEYAEITKLITYLQSLLASESLLYQVIRTELLDVSNKYADPRRTRIIPAEKEFAVEDLIAEEDAVITITHRGYIKRLPADTYRTQRRGGKGVTALTTRDEDFVESIFITSTHHYLMFFTNTGRVYRLKVHELPEGGRTAKGTAIINLLKLEKGESITATIPVKDFVPGFSLFMATRKGVVKKTSLLDFANLRSSGIIAISIDKGDSLVAVRLISADQQLILGTSDGIAIRIEGSQVREMGRSARGVRGIKLAAYDYLVDMAIVKPDADVCVITENGYGKRTSLNEFKIQARGGKGIIAIKTSERNGALVAMMVVEDGEDLMMISHEGIIIRVDVEEISRLGRATQGVRLMKLEEKGKVVDVAKVATREEEEKVSEDESIID
ncbi:MAG: DNA gyrase subunit A [Clostridia bacterium]